MTIGFIGQGEKRIQGELSKTREGALGYLELRKTLPGISGASEQKYRQGILLP